MLSKASSTLATIVADFGDYIVDSVNEALESM